MKLNKKERNNVLVKLKPLSWYTFCLVEAKYESGVQISKVKLAAELNISVPTLTKYLAIWESFGLIKEIPNGFLISQIDGAPSAITGEIKPERKFKKAKDIINFFCELYFEEFGVRYTVSNWAVAQKQVKKILSYTDAEIEGGVRAAVKLYSTRWVNVAYPRPSIGALSSWLFQQALPYAEKEFITTCDNGDSNNLLSDLEAKGWM